MASVGFPLVILGLNFTLEGQKQLCPSPCPELPSYHGLAGWDITSTGDAPSGGCDKGRDGATWVDQGTLISVVPAGPSWELARWHGKRDRQELSSAPAQGQPVPSASHLRLAANIREEALVKKIGFLEEKWEAVYFHEAGVQFVSRNHISFCRLQ